MRIIKLILNLLVALFLFLLFFNLLFSHDVGFFVFSLTFLLLFTFFRMIFALIELKLKQPEAISKKLGKILAVVLFLVAILLFVYIFFQWWRLFFEERLKLEAAPFEYQGLIKNIRVLGYLGFIYAFWMVLSIFKKWPGVYLILPALLVFVNYFLTFFFIKGYFPDFPIPIPPGKVLPSMPGVLGYQLSRLPGLLIFYLPFISLSWAFILQKAIDILKSPLEIKLNTVSATISFYLAIILVELLGFLSLAMVTQPW